jgi:N-acetylglutamate synthase-like GNAT family acetyltransferase
MEVRQVDYQDIKQMLREAVRDLVTMQDTPYTIWLGGFVEDKIIGCAGVSFGQPATAHLRSLYVVAEHRHRGHGTVLLKEAIALARSKQSKAIKALVYRPAFYAPHGFQVISSYEMSQGTVYRTKLGLEP